MRVFETRTATGSELFSLLTCFHTTTFTLLSIFSPLEMISTKIWETPLSWRVKCSLPVAVRVSKMRNLKLPNTGSPLHSLITRPLSPHPARPRLYSANSPKTQAGACPQASCRKERRMAVVERKIGRPKGTVVSTLGMQNNVFFTWR